MRARQKRRAPQPEPLHRNGRCRRPRRSGKRQNEANEREQRPLLDAGPRLCSSEDAGRQGERGRHVASSAVSGRTVRERGLTRSAATDDSHTDYGDDEARSRRARDRARDG